MVIPEICPAELSSVVKRDGEIPFYRLNMQLSAARLQSSLAEALRIHPFVLKDARPHYQGLGLYYSNILNQFTDALDTVVEETYSADLQGKKTHAQNRTWNLFPHRNAAGECFAWLEEMLAPIRVVRGRLLKVLPGCKPNVFHVDKGEWRIHVPITTDPRAYIEALGRKWHLKNDGSIYLLNTNIPHRIWHEGEQERTHLVYTIYPETILPMPHVLRELRLLPMDGAPLSVLGSLAAFREAVYRQQDYHCALCSEPQSELSLIPRHLRLNWELVAQAPALGFWALCEPCISMVMSTNPADPKILLNAIEQKITYRVDH